MRGGRAPLRLRPREGRAGLPPRAYPAVGRHPLRPRPDGVLPHRRILPAAAGIHQVGGDSVNEYQKDRTVKKRIVSQLMQGIFDQPMACRANRP